MTEPTVEVRLARLYRMLFHYETDLEAEFAPAWLSALGQMDCILAIGLIERQMPHSTEYTEVMLRLKQKELDNKSCSCSSRHSTKRQS